MNESIYADTGRQMIESFLARWGWAMLYVYTDGPRLPDHGGRVVYRRLEDNTPWLFEFIDRDRSRRQKHYNRDATRFAYKSAAIVHGSLNIPERYAVWLDADIFTHTPIHRQVLLGILNGGLYSCYLGREGYHSEGGFYSWDTSQPHHGEYMDRWKNFYLSDTIYSLDYWHDCGIYDRLRPMFGGAINFKNLSPWGKKTDHVFVQSMLGDYMDHLKGIRRKSKGRTDKKDLGKIKKHGEYWK